MVAFEILIYDHLPGSELAFYGVSINIRPPSGSTDLLSNAVSIIQMDKGYLRLILNPLKNDIDRLFNIMI